MEIGSVFILCTLSFLVGFILNEILRNKDKSKLEFSERLDK